MASKEKVIASGKQLLLAYVAIRRGDIRDGAKLFVKAAQDENIDPLVDGLAESISNLQAMDEEATPVNDTDAQLTGLEDMDEDSGAEESAAAEGEDDDASMGAETPAGEDTPAGDDSTPEDEDAPAAPVQSRAKKFKAKKKETKVKASAKKDKGIKMLASVAKVLDLKKIKY
jgi:hypothetical protein